MSKVSPAKSKCVLVRTDIHKEIFCIEVLGVSYTLIKFNTKASFMCCSGPNTK